MAIRSRSLNTDPPNAPPGDPPDGPPEALRRPVRIAGDSDRIELRGRPGQLVGVVSMARGPEPESFKTATTDLRETRSGYLSAMAFAPLVASSLPSTAHEPPPLFLGRMLAPNSTGRVPISFSVDPTTPPGTYEATFDVAGEQRTASIEVLPDEKLAILPGRVKLAGQPGEVVEETLIFENRGNVPVELGALGLLVLQQEQQLCLSLQAGLANVKEGRHQEFLDGLVSSLAQRKTDLGRVRIADGKITVEPGQAEQARVSFHLPANMAVGRQYRALLRCKTAQLFTQITALGPGGTRVTDAAELEADETGIGEPTP